MEYKQHIDIDCRDLVNKSQLRQSLLLTFLVTILTIFYRLNQLDRTPLQIAASKGYIDVVKLLLENNADPNVIDKYGSSPLSEAHNQEIASLLYQYINKWVNETTPGTKIIDQLITQLISV